MTPQPAWLSQKRRRADSNRCSGRDGQSRTERSWRSGFWLFASIVVLAAVPLFSLDLGRYALGVLGLISVLACVPVHRQRSNWVAPPERRGVKSGGGRT